MKKKPALTGHPRFYIHNYPEMLAITLRHSLTWFLLNCLIVTNDKTYTIPGLLCSSGSKTSDMWWFCFQPFQMPLHFLLPVSSGVVFFSFFLYIFMQSSEKLELSAGGQSQHYSAKAQLTFTFTGKLHKVALSRE